MINSNKRLRFILVIDFLLFIICFLGIYKNIQKAGLEPEKHISFRLEENSLSVNEVHQSDLKKILSKNDKLVSVSNHAMSGKEDIEFVLDSFLIGDSVSFSIIRNGSLINLQVKLPKYYSLFENITQVLVGLVFFVLGVFVLLKRPLLLMANVWHWASIATAIIMTAIWGAYSPGSFGVGQLTRIFFFMAYAFVPTLFIHLSFVFPRYKWHNLKRLIYPLYGFSIFLALFMAFAFLQASHSVSVDWFHKLMSAFNLNRAYFALAMVLGVLNIFHSSINAQEESERRQIRWVVFGLAIGPPSFVFLWQIPQLLSFDPIISEALLVQIMLIIPVTFSIAIVRHHVFNIDHIFQRSTIYLFMALILLIIYAALVGLSVLFIGFITVESSLIMTIIAAILTPLFFEPLRRGLQKVIDKKFFRVRYNYRIAQRRFTEELGECLNRDAIVQMAIRRIDDLLQLTYSAIFIKNEINMELEIAASKDFGKVAKKLVDILYLHARQTDQTILTRSNNVEAGLEFENVKVEDAEIIPDFLGIPLKTIKDEIIGMLILGKKKSGQKYTLEDIDLLKTIAIQTGLAIQRTELQKQLLLKNLETEKLNELNQLKSYFVSSVSHDLQSPLTSIKMFAELLNEKKNIPEQKRSEYLKIIEGESSRLSRLISNVLDFSKIERGRQDYIFNKVNINELIKNVVMIMDYQLKQHDFELIENYSDKDIFMCGDEDALISVGINLLSNAIKYSNQQKSINITTEIKNEMALIQFTDKGLGISDEDKKHIFDTFYRSKEENIQSSGGAGLGLTLVNHVVKAHNGTIEVESILGQGSTFTLCFPIIED